MPACSCGAQADGADQIDTYPKQPRYPSVFKYFPLNASIPNTLPEHRLNEPSACITSTEMEDMMHDSPSLSSVRLLVPSVMIVALMATLNPAAAPAASIYSWSR